MSKIDIKVLEGTQQQEVSDFLTALGAENPSVLAYYHPFYRDMLVSIDVGTPYYLTAYRNGKMVGLLPGFLRTGEEGEVYCSMPFFGPNAGVLTSRNGEAKEIHQALLGHLMQELNRKTNLLAASLYTPFLWDHFEWYDEFLPGAVVTQRFTQFLSLDEELKWDKKLRYDLRKAHGMNLRIITEVTPERIDRFYDIYHQNCVEHDIPIKPKKVMDFLSSVGVSQGFVQCYFAYLESEMVAGLFILSSKQTVSYYAPCTLASARSMQPGSLLIEQAIQDSRQKGLRYWNWEASQSRDSGVYSFKNKWGSKEGEYRIYTVPFKEPRFFSQLGATRISTDFPYFFVYPFDRI